MDRLEIYVPFGRLDTGLRVLLLVWLLTPAVGFAMWLLKSRARQP